MKELKIRTVKPYSVFIADKFSKLNNKISAFLSGERVAVITDKKVNKLWINELKKHLPEKQLFVFAIKGGEKSKNLKTHAKIINFLAKNNFTRKDGVIGFGGGVAIDIAGFCASTYMRGINYISIPTTLLADIDASVGGKTGVNLKYGKNLCGTFYQPSAVFIALSFLKTLPKKELLNGYGEMLKYGFLNKNVKVSKKLTEDLIYNLLSIKRQIVEKDEKENNFRKLLNFGHTFGHAIEKRSNYTVSHGIAVAKGIKIALIISKNYFKYGDELLKEFEKQANIFGIDLSIKYSFNSLIKEIIYDKKRKGDKIDLVLIDKNHVPKITPINTDKVKDYLQ